MSQRKIQCERAVPKRVAQYLRMSTQLRKLGQSDLAITPIGMGVWAIGGGQWEFAWGPQNDEQSITAIHAGLDPGINWFDTAAQDV